MKPLFYTLTITTFFISNFALALVDETKDYSDLKVKCTSSKSDGVSFYVGKTKGIYSIKRSTRANFKIYGNKGSKSEKHISPVMNKGVFSRANILDNNKTFSWVYKDSGNYRYQFDTLRKNLLSNTKKFAATVKVTPPEGFAKELIVNLSCSSKITITIKKIETVSVKLLDSLDGEHRAAIVGDAAEIGHWGLDSIDISDKTFDRYENLSEQLKVNAFGKNKKLQKISNSLDDLTNKLNEEGVAAYADQHGISLEEAQELDDDSGITIVDSAVVHTKNNEFVSAVVSVHHNEGIDEADGDGIEVYFYDEKLDSPVFENESEY